MKKAIETNKSPMPAGPYSQGIQINKRIYVAGQGPLDVTTGKFPEGIQAQTRQVLQNIKNILEAGGASMDDVVKTTVHLTDLSYFQEFNQAYSEFFTAPYPVRTTVGSQLSGILVEIDVIAELE